MPDRTELRVLLRNPPLAEFRAVLCLVLLGLVAVGALAQSLETREQELAEIRLQIDRLNERVVAMRSKESSIEDKLSRVSTELELQQAKLEEANAALLLATSRADTTVEKIAETEEALDQVRGDLRRRLSGLYLLGRRGYLRLFLSAEPGGELLPALRQLRYLVRRDQRAAESYTELRERLLAQRSRLESERREVAEWQNEEKGRHERLLEIQRERRRLLDQVTSERRRLAARATALEDKERKLLAFVDGLVNDAGQPLEGAPILELRGVLDWPARGEVVQEFGAKKDPRYRTEVPHNGFDLALDAGTKVRVVYPGEVVFAGPFEGYGTMVVVHHPGSVFTLYAGLELLGVARGDMLSLGDVIGASAERLYFEIRVDNQPENPRQWLR